jgi:hypothetical protein
MLHLSLRDPGAPFADEAWITELETELVVMEKKVQEGLSGSFEEKKKKEEELRELKKGNIYRNELIMLSSQFQAEEGVQRLIDDFRATRATVGKGCQ